MAWCVSKGSGIVAQGRRGSVRVEAAAWDRVPAGAGRPLPHPVDAQADGRTTQLSLPGPVAWVRGPAGTRRATGRVSLGDEEVLVVPDGPVETVLRFDDAARVTTPTLASGSGGEAGDSEWPAGREWAARGPMDGGSPATTADPGARITVAFADPTRVTVGFRDGATDPPTMTVPPTPDGVATVLTHASAALRTTGPERSHPSQRDHPPLVTLGETTDVPAVVRQATPRPDIDLHLPATLSTCSLAAPLAFYLGASIHVAEGATPRLRAPGAGVDRTLPSEDGAFADETAALLRRVFFLDCLVRDRPGERLAATDLLDQAGLEAPHLRSLSPAGRLAAYLEAPFDRIEADLPTWPLATYVDGGERTVRCLPHLLDRLSLVCPASASELDGGSLLRRALDGFYRGPATGRVDESPPTATGDSGTCRTAGDVATADRLAPDLCDARLHGWLAEGTPVEVFNATPTAYRNRLETDRQPGALDIAVVCNDPELTGERTVADIYRERAADLPVDVSVHDSLSRHALADLLEQPHDFLHYIGHCEREGLRCRDGYLDVADLETVGTRTFFLNACGSYLQGQRLVERGSVAGAVTLTTVLDRHAATVGTAFARLLIHGVDFERALSLARQQVLTGSDYAVVGDGTYAPVPAGEPAVLHVAETETGFEVTREMLSADAPGRSHRSPFADGDHLDGGVTRVRRDRTGTVALLRAQSLPTCHDGRLYWSTDLADELAADAE